MTREEERIEAAKANYPEDAILRRACEIGAKWADEHPHEKYESPQTPIKDVVEVSSRMKYIDEDLKPIAEFILEYASWNLHKDEWNHPVLEVPVFRVLDALAQRGKPYCESV